MSVALSARVLAVCLAGASTGARADPPTEVAPAAPTSIPTSASAPPATGTSAASPPATAGPTASANGAPAAPRTRERPPPAVIFVPLLGTIVLPLTVPTAVPRGRATPPADSTEKAP